MEIREIEFTGSKAVITFLLTFNITAKYINMIILQLRYKYIFKTLTRTSLVLSVYYKILSVD